MTQNSDVPKQSYYHCIDDEPLVMMTLGQLAEHTSRKYGGRYAIKSCHQNKHITFRDSLEEADRLAAGFRKIGLLQGDKIGLWLPNLFEWYIAFIACARGGFITVLMNPNFQSEEVTNLINKVNVKLLICGGQFRRQNYYQILTKVCPELTHSKPGKLFSSRVPSLRSIVMVTNDNNDNTADIIVYVIHDYNVAKFNSRCCSFPSGQSITVGDVCKNAIRNTSEPSEKNVEIFKFSDILNMADPEIIQKIKDNQYNINADDPCNIQFTSGTTGDPKVVVHSHFMFVNNGYFSGKRTELHKKYHKICIQNPLFHAFGTTVIVCSSLHYGSTIVLPSDGYDVEENLTTIVKEMCTVVSGTPTMFVDLVASQRKRQETLNLEIVLCGGSVCVPKLFKDIINTLQVKKVKHPLPIRGYIREDKYLILSEMYGQNGLTDKSRRYRENFTSKYSHEKTMHDVFHRLLESSDPPISSFQQMTIEKEKQPPPESVYGQTETTGGAFFSTERDTQNQSTDTVGKVFPHIEAKVIDNEGKIVPYGVPGELCLRGFSIIRGYYENKQKTKEVIDPYGWMHTGDQFILFDGGYGSIVGRLKDVIVRGGENIYPRDIEDYLLNHPDILEVQVVGLPHERLGEEVCACLRTRYHRQLTVNDLYQFCQGKIADFKIPSVVKVMDSFPINFLGKIQRHKIVEMIMTDV